MIVGDSLAPLPPDDLRFVLDLGLVRETDDERARVDPEDRAVMARLSLGVEVKTPRASGFDQRPVTRILR